MATKTDAFLRAALMLQKCHAILCEGEPPKDQAAHRMHLNATIQECMRNAAIKPYALNDHILDTSDEKKTILVFARNRLYEVWRHGSRKEHDNVYRCKRYAAKEMVVFATMAQMKNFLNATVKAIAS